MNLTPEAPSDSHLVLDNASIADVKAWIAKQDFVPPLLITLKGELGAGKTEWVRQFVASLGGEPQNVTSPTYSLQNIYFLADGTLIHHWDLYRIESLEELDSIGFWDQFASPGYIVVEWPEVLGLPVTPIPQMHLQVKKVSPTTVRLYAAI